MDMYRIEQVDVIPEQQTSLAMVLRRGDTWDDTGCMGNRWGVVRVWGLRGTGGEYQDKTEERDLTWGQTEQLTHCQVPWSNPQLLKKVGSVPNTCRVWPTSRVLDGKNFGHMYNKMQC